MVNRVVEMTFLVIIIGLVLANPQAFSGAVKTISEAYTSSVKTLSGVARA